MFNYYRLVVALSERLTVPGVDPEWLEALGTVRRELNGKRWVYALNLPLHDERTGKVRSRLEGLGLVQVRGSTMRKDNESFSMTLMVEWEDSDLEEAEYLSVLGSLGGVEPETLGLDDGVLRYTESIEGVPDAPVGLLFGSTLMSLDCLRAIDPDGQLPLTVREIGVEGEDAGVSERFPTKCLLDVKPSLILPPMDPGVKFMSVEGKPWTWESSQGGLFSITEDHPNGTFEYRRSDLAEVGDFDIALTYEAVGRVPLKEDRRVWVFSRSLFERLKPLLDDNVIMRPVLIHD